MRHPRIVVVWLLALAGVGCTPPVPGPPVGPLRPPAGRTLVFENAGTEPVKLYLSEGGSEWFVGYVLPGRTDVLPLPATVAASTVGRQFSLVVVASSASRSIRDPRASSSSTIRSDGFTSDYLTAVRWNVAGRWLVALPDPAVRGGDSPPRR